MPKMFGSPPHALKTTKKVLSEEDSEIRRLANDKCRRKHPNYFDSLICVGPGSSRGFSPPCDSCLEEAKKEKERENKLLKAQGRRLSDEEAAEVRKKLGKK